jgi:circadian clock protein KaiC
MAGAAAMPRGKVGNRNGSLPKVSSGIQGLDEITGGGLPAGRPTLIAGAAGSGKTLFSLEFLVRGATDYGEPGVFMAFEERAEELVKNVASLGFDLKGLTAKKKLVVDHVRVERSEIEETGEYDLEGLFVRLAHAIDSIGARRVVLDTIESLFSGLRNESILRAELRRLFTWLKDKGVTSVITAERGEDTLTRHGLEEYVADCVILLDHRVTDQISTRRLRVVKYRGSSHGTNEYPFLIGEHGIFLVPITSMGLEYSVPGGRISSGIERLDAMLGGKGFHRGSSILVSGTPGTGKSSIAATFADAACRRGEKVLYFAFEESKEQIFRNMRSIGIDLSPCEEQGVLKVHAVRPALLGLEAHLLTMNRLAEEFKPRVVVIDPVSNLTAVGDQTEVTALLSRLIDYYKSRHITTMFTSLVTRNAFAEESSGVGISSLMDTWILLEDVETNGERNRGLYILKSRGMAHSNQIREFRLTDEGIDLRDISLSTDGVLMGSARAAQEAREKAEAALRGDEVSRRRRLLDQKRHELEAKVASLKSEFAAQEEELSRYMAEEDLRNRAREKTRAELARMRKADAAKRNGKTGSERGKRRGARG